MRISQVAKNWFAQATAVVASFSIPLNLSPVATAKIVESLSQYSGQVVKDRAPHYSHAPVAVPFNGPFSFDPGRGVWSADDLRRIKGQNQAADLQANTTPGAGQSMRIVPIDPDAGIAYHWERLDWASLWARANTATGNLLTSVPLFSYPTRGGGTFNITLFHNSKASYYNEIGGNWSWTYDIHVVFVGARPSVRYGDGLSVPFNEGVGGAGQPTVYPPARGIYDKLTEYPDGTFLLQKKGGTNYYFNARGVCTAIADPNGNSISIVVNPQGYATAVVDPSGRVTTISRDSMNRVSSFTDPSGRVWSLSRSGTGPFDVLKLDGSTLETYSYTSSDQIASRSGSPGGTQNYTYYLDGAVATVAGPVNNTIHYDYYPGQTIQQKPSGVVTDSYYDGQLYSVKDEAGFTYAITQRDARTHPTTTVDRRGFTQTATWDNQGNQTTQTDALGHTSSATYDSHGRVLTSTDPLGNTTTHTYDFGGNLLTTTDPRGTVVQTVTYDGIGNPVTVTDALNKTTSLTYNANGWPLTVTDPTGRTSTFSYGAMGQVLTATDPAGATETVTYNNRLWPVRLTHPDQSYVTLTYNSVGMVTSRRDEELHFTTLNYDLAHRLTSVVNGRGDTEVYTYDAADRRLTARDGNNHTRTYAYTARGEVNRLTLADGAVEQWTYDGEGNTTGYTNPLVQTVGYVYDGAGRQTKVDYPTGVDTTFAYDAADRRTTMVDANGTTTWAYDAASRVTVFTPITGFQNQAYDLADRRTALQDGSAGTTTTAYDAASRVLTLTNPQGQTTAFAYDSAGRLATKTFGSGQYETYSYDTRSRLLSVVLKNSAASVLQSQGYTYDLASRMTSSTLGGVTTSYAYDNADQLVSESRPGYEDSYSYDSNGNRLSKTLNGVVESYSYDVGDKLLVAGGKSYTYDAAGRTRTVVSGGQTTTLNYDYESRVTSVVAPTGTSYYAYNGLDTRTAKLEGGVYTGQVRDGAGVTAPVIRDSQASYTPGVSETRAGVTSYLHSGLKDATAQTSVGQVVTASRVYDAFGMVVSSTGTWKGPFGYAGEHGYQEDATGLQLLGHRYYDPSTGRFLTRDPIKDGRNWYGYCADDPLRLVDSSGLKSSGGALTVAQGLAIAFCRLPIWLQRLLAPLFGSSFLATARRVAELQVDGAEDERALLQALVSTAQREVGGTGPISGIARHQWVYDKLPPDWKTEVSFQSGALVRYGLVGSRRVDIISPSGMHFDLKFGIARDYSLRKLGEIISQTGQSPTVVRPR